MPKTYKRQMAEFVALCLFATLFEGAVAWAWYHEQAPLLSLAFLHFAFCVGLYGVHWFSRSPALEIYRGLLVIGTFLLGPIGAVCTFIGFVFTAVLDKFFPAHFDLTADDLFDLSPEEGDHHIFRHIKHYKVQETSLQIIDQLMDAFKYGSDEEKQNVLAVINNHYQPKLAKILRLALMDTNNVIRIQAAAILADLEQRQQNELMALEETVKAENTPESKLALAKHYDAMAHSGVVDAVRKETYLNNATTIYEQALRVHPDDVDLAKKLARAYYRLGRTAEAVALIRPFAIELADIPLSLWYLELLFVTKQTQELRTLAAELAPKVVNNHDYPIKLQKAVQLWAM